MASVKKKADLFSSSQANGATRKPNNRMIFSQNRRGEERIEREKIVIWRRPVQTLSYFFRELNYTRITFAEKAKKYRATVILSSVLLVSFYILLHTEGPHQNVSFKLVFRDYADAKTPLFSFLFSFPFVQTKLFQRTRMSHFKSILFIYFSSVFSIQIENSFPQNKTSTVLNQNSFLFFGFNIQLHTFSNFVLPISPQNWVKILG